MFVNCSLFYVLCDERSFTTHASNLTHDRLVFVPYHAGDQYYALSYCLEAVQAPGQTFVQYK